MSNTAYTETQNVTTQSSPIASPASTASTAAAAPPRAHAQVNSQESLRTRVSQLKTRFMGILDTWLYRLERTVDDWEEKTFHRTHPMNTPHTY